MNGFDDDALARTVMASLPVPLGDEAAQLFMDAKIQRWPASVSAQPGGLPVRSARTAHLPEARQHAGL
jgi:hypothetical protein